MERITVSDAIGRYMKANPNGFGDDLIALHSVEMETNATPRTSLPGVEVYKEAEEITGKKVERKRGTIWTDGIHRWWSIRIPKGSWDKPEFKDYPCPFPLELYTLEIGMSGWNWRQQHSIYVAADVDKLFANGEKNADGHAKGLTEEEITALESRLADIPYVAVRRSTRGGGRHIYIFLDNIPTANHTEHATLARAAFLKLSKDTGIDILDSVDVFGGIVYIWSRRATKENRGYELLKPHTTKLCETDLSGWRDAIVEHKRRCAARVNLGAEGPKSETDLFDFLSDSYPTFERDDTHKAIATDIAERGWTIMWNDHAGYYETHTAGLAESHAALRLKGTFETVSPGNDKSKPNCMATPRPNGSFHVMRFQSAAEHDSWKRTGSGKAYCLYNVGSDPNAACAAAGGIKGESGYTFNDLDSVKEALVEMGLPADKLGGLDTETKPDRQVNVKIKSDEVTVNTERLSGETPEGWATSQRKLSVIFQMPKPDPEQDNGAYDDIVRRIVNDDDGVFKDGGYLIKTLDGDWTESNAGGAKGVLMSTGLSATDAARELGAINRRPWHEVNEPFQPAFLTGRQWNIRGAQLRFKPAESVGTTKHWDSIFNHCGDSLTDIVRADAWCQEAGIRSGGDFLRTYAACLVRKPKQKLPYLFFVSEGAHGQGTGKSSFHRAIDLLFARGSVECKLALQENFNSRLGGSVFCYLEDVQLNAQAYGRIKQWLDAPRLTVRRMHHDTYSLPNYCHFVQSGNHLSDCYMEVGDTRIIVLEVAKLNPKIWLDWDTELSVLLKDEAPSFLAKLNALSLPPPAPKCRFYLPVFETPPKRFMLADALKAAEKSSKTLFDALLRLVDDNKKVVAETGVWVWDCTVPKLIERLGRNHGVWSSAPNSFSRQLKKPVLVKRLKDNGIQIEWQQRKKNKRPIRLIYTPPPKIEIPATASATEAAQ